jgi:hypothetical protein
MISSSRLRQRLFHAEGLLFFVVVVGGGEGGGGGGGWGFVFKHFYLDWQKQENKIAQRNITHN